MHKSARPMRRYGMDSFEGIRRGDDEIRAVFLYVGCHTQMHDVTQRADWRQAGLDPLRRVCGY